MGLLVVFTSACIVADPSIVPLWSAPWVAWLQVTLQDQVEIAGEDSEAITTFLESRVERMIQKARSRAVGGRPAILPLIRLRVSPLAYPWIQNIARLNLGPGILIRC